MSNSPKSINRRGPQPGTNSPQVALQTARDAWGDDLDDWVIALAEACDRSSQNAVGKRLNYSGSVVSAVINHNYKGTYTAIEQAVRGALLSEVHDCPVLGALNLNMCLTHQRKAQRFQPTSSLRVALYKTCKGNCPHSRIANKEDPDA